jgi:hypothetical protein
MGIINLTSGMRFGAGVDRLTEQARGIAIEYEGVQDGFGGQTVNPTVQMVESQQSLMEQMNLSVSASARYGLVSGDAKFDLAKEHAVNQSSVYLLLKASVRNAPRYMIRPRLTNEAARIYRNDPEEFRQIYGDTFIDEIYSGGDFFGLFIFETRDERSRTDIKASLRMSVSGVMAGGTIEAAFRNTLEEASKTSNTQIHVVMAGGRGALNPTNISELNDLYVHFNEMVSSNPVDYQANIKDFRYLPLPPGSTWAEQAVRRDVIEQCGQRIIEGLQLRSDIAFIRKYPDQFLGPDLPALETAYTQIDSLLPDLAARARECSLDIARCTLGDLGQIPAVQLPTRLTTVDPLEAKWRYVLEHDSRAAPFFPGPVGPITNYDEHRGGRYKLFFQDDGRSGGIFWHPEVDDGKAHVVYGEIFKEYARRGHCEGSLGYPTMDEETLGHVLGYVGSERMDDLDRVSGFEHGSLWWDAQTNSVHERVSYLTTHVLPILNLDFMNRFPDR